MGLLVGASILTVVEFVDFCIETFSRWYRQRKKRKIKAGPVIFPEIK